ncbi:hypothetical protein ACFLYE_04050 [Chloroflexota bacterium]
MENEKPAAKEFIIKEYPKTTYWLDGKLVRAIGNLILTNERLVFLRQVFLSPEQTTSMQKIIQEGHTSELLQFALRLHNHLGQDEVPFPLPHPPISGSLLLWRQQKGKDPELYVYPINDKAHPDVRVPHNRMEHGHQ